MERSGLFSVSRNFKGPYIDRVTCLIQTGTLKALYEFDIHVFVFKIVYFNLLFLSRNDLRIFGFRNNGEVIRIKKLSSKKNYDIFRIFNLIKVLMVSL